MKTVEIIWHGVVSDLIIMFNGTFMLILMLTDGGKRGLAFTGEFPLKVHGMNIILSLDREP